MWPIIKEDEDTVGLQENYNSLLEKLGEYARVAKVAVKKMKKAEDGVLKSRIGIHVTVSYILGSHASERETVTTEQVRLGIKVRVQL